MDRVGMDFLYIIVIVAIIHGVFLAGLLFSYRKGNTSANRLLGMFMISTSATLSFRIVYHTPLVFFCFPFAYTFGPLFYLYVKVLIKPHISLRLRDMLHGVPFGLVQAFMVFLATGGYRDHISTEEIGKSAVTIVYWGLVMVIIHVHIALYFILAWRLINDHRKRISHFFSTIDIVNLSWLQYFMFLLVTVFSVSTTLTFVMPRLGFPERECDMAASLVISLFIFAMGYRGLLQPQIFTSTALMRENGEKYKKSPFKREKAKMHIDEIYHLMEKEELYTNPDLTLDMLVERISASRHLLSRILSEVVQMNFYDFVNRYRVEKVKSGIQNDAKREMSLLELAYEAGFNSKSTFNAAFKKHTGITPTQFKDYIRSKRKAT